MEFRILGPLEVLDDEGRALPLGGARQRALLAALLLHANEIVLTDRLVDELWGESPPTTGTKALHVAVSQLRKALGNGVVQTRPAGYLLKLDAAELDLARFELLRERARDALAGGNASAAAAALREALALWRGPALADVASEAFAHTEAERLEELRLVTLEERIEADLMLGRHAELVGELEALVAKHPLREAFRGHLMLALYRAGRQAEALDVYRDTRRMLRDELGIEPSTRLQELERAILRHDPALEGPSRALGVTVPLARVGPILRRPRGLIAAGLAAGVLVAGAAAVLALDPFGSSGGLRGVAPNSVGVIDPATNEVVDEIPVGESPGPMAVGAGALWVLNRNSRTISEIDPRTREVRSTSGVGGAPNAVAVGGAGGWAPSTSVGGSVLFVLEGPTGHEAGTLYFIDPRNLSIATGIRLAEAPGADFAGAEIAAVGDELWITQTHPPQVIRVRPTVVASDVSRVQVATAPSAVTGDADWVWVALKEDDAVVLVDPLRRDLVATVPVGRRPEGIAVGAGAVWVSNSDDGTVTRLTSRPIMRSATIRVGRDPEAVAVGAGGVWVANHGDGTVSRIDPKTNEVVATIQLGNRPEDVVIAGGLVWVSVRAG